MVQEHSLSAPLSHSTWKGNLKDPKSESEHHVGNIDITWAQKYQKENKQQHLTKEAEDFLRCFLWVGSWTVSWIPRRIRPFPRCSHPKGFPICPSQHLRHLGWKLTIFAAWAWFLHNLHHHHYNSPSPAGPWGVPIPPINPFVGVELSRGLIVCDSAPPLVCDFSHLSPPETMQNNELETEGNINAKYLTPLHIKGPLCDMDYV